MYSLILTYDLLMCRAPSFSWLRTPRDSWPVLRSGSMEDTASYRCLAKVSTTIFRLVSPRFVSSVLISSPTTIPHHRHKKTQNEERIFTKSCTYKRNGLVHLLENAILEEGHLVLVFCFCFFSSFDHLVLFPVSPPIISVLFTSFTNTHWFFFSPARRF